MTNDEAFQAAINYFDDAVLTGLFTHAETRASSRLVIGHANWSDVHLINSHFVQHAVPLEAVVEGGEIGFVPRNLVPKYAVVLVEGENKVTLCRTNSLQDAFEVRAAHQHGFLSCEVLEVATEAYMIKS